jgi:hypothetical protein
MPCLRQGKKKEMGAQCGWEGIRTKKQTKTAKQTQKKNQP